MKTTHYIIFSIVLSLLPSVLEGQTPKEFLKEVSESCKAIEEIEYESRIETTGFYVEAKVIQRKADVKDVGFGKSMVIVEGSFNMPDKSQPFAFSYDGVVFKFHEEGKGEIKVIESPEPRVLGRTLGLYYYMVVQSLFGADVAMDNIINRATKLEFVQGDEQFGSNIRGVNISQVFTNPATSEKRESTSSWFIDEATMLPVGYKSKGGMVKKTTILKVTNKSENLFDINASSGLLEKTITGKEPNTEGLLEVGSTFPKFELNDHLGQPRKLKDQNKKVYLIDFWGTWCGPCLLAMPKLQKLHEKYSAKGLEVLGISVFDKPGKAEGFVKEKGFTYSFLVQGDKFAKSMGLDTYPTIFLVDSEGKVLHAEKGNRTDAQKDFEKIIETELNKDE